MKIAFTKLKENARVPSYGSALAAGADLYAAIDESVTLAPGETRLIPHGLAMAIPEGYAGFIYARSGLATRRNLAPANKVGVVDADYRGELMTPIHNHGSTPAVIEPGERVAQLVIAPILHAEFIETDSLDETERGAGGFGSTGTR